MKLEHKNISFEIKAFDDETREFEAYASTFGNTDLVNDVIEKGAFRKTVSQAKKTGKYPKLLYQHNSTKLVGVIKSMKEDDAGLLIKGDFIDTTVGRDTYVEVKSGAIGDMSIGFYAKQYEIDEEKGLRTIKEIDLFEVSFVTFPANPEANVLAVKSEIKTKRDLEKLLRDVGFSLTEAKSIVADGYQGLVDHRDVEIASEDEELDAKALEKLTQAIDNMNKTLRS